MRKRFGHLRLQKTTMKVFAILFALFVAVSARRYFHNDQVLRTYPEEQQITLLEGLPEKYGVDFWTEPRGIAPVDIHVPKENVAAVKVFLTKMRINHEIFIENLQEAIDNQVSPRKAQMSLGSFDYNVYHTLDEINQWIDDIVSTYSIASKEEVGTSYEGRQFHALKISTGGASKPAFVINCGLHAREWVGPASCMYAVKYFVEAQEGSEEYDLLSNMDIYVTPSSNPDGYLYTWDGDRMWRKTRSINVGKRCDGVDPNRNWDVNWSGPGASSSACNDAYYGPSVFSEIEVRSQRDFVQSIPNVKAYIDVHAYSQYWMYPYGYIQGPPANDVTLLSAIGQDSVAAIYAVHGKTYQTGAISDVIYVASGSTADYFYEKQGIRCSFAAELRDTGLYGFTLPERFIQPTAEETFAGLKVIASYVANGQC